MKTKISIDEAYFGIKMPELSWSNANERKMKKYNLFSFLRVKWSVAKYVTMTKEERETMLSDPLRFCFGDVWGRCEYEFVVTPWGGLDENDKVVDVGQKVDVYSMYVEPNADYLMSIVNRITKTSAQRYLREERKRLKRGK